jgi:hypothetical protein
MQLQSVKVRNLKLLALFLFIGTYVSILSLNSIKAENDDPTKWTIEQWTSWRDQKISEILNPVPDDASGQMVINREKVIDKCGEINQLLSTVLKQDPNYFKKNSDLSRRMSNFIAFVQAQSLMFPNDTSNHALGFTITDQEYWDYAKSNLEFPDLLKSQEFLALMTSPATYAQAVAAIENQNSYLPPERKWLVLPFEAQFIKSIRDEGHGRTYGRMLVLIPNTPTADGGSMDRWFLFSLATPNQPVAGDIRPVSLITMVNPAPGGGKKSQKVYFMDFIRERDPSTTKINLTPTVLSNGHTSKNCFDCHKSGILPIRPANEFEFIGGVMKPKTTNDGIISGKANSLIWLYRKRYGVPDWGSLDPLAYGPSIGPEGRIRTNEFIMRVNSDLNLPATSVENVKIAMDCASCHKDFAPLNYMQAVQSNRDFSSFRRKEGIIRTYIEEGWMPPGFGLTSLEKKALWRSLMTEYFDMETQTGVLVDWLKGIDPDLNNPSDTLVFNKELFSSSIEVENNLMNISPSNPLKKKNNLITSKISAEKGLISGKLYLSQKNYVKAEKSLWNAYKLLLERGLRGKEGLIKEKVILDSLKKLYQVWKSPESVAGAKRLFAIEQSSGHGDN